MTTSTHTLECPYCGELAARDVARPAFPERLPSAGRPQLVDEPTDVRTMPYVRDVGTFDPGPTDDWDSPDRGSWVGSDFMPALRFDARFGILTSADGRWPGVLYRVERCPRCLHHFDAYYSFRPDRPLSVEFPHLFAPDGQLLDLPGHEPLPWIFVSRMKRTSASGAPAIAGAVGVWWALAAASMALVRLVVDRFTWLEYAVTLGSLLVALGAAGLLLHILRTLLTHLSCVPPMDEVIACDGAPDGDPVLRSNRVRHWISFTRCRYTGRPVEGRTLRTATELLGGVTAVASLMVVVLLAGGMTPSVLLPRLVDAIWWFPVAYMLGSSLQLGATTVHYVLEGLTRVPIRLDQFHPTTGLAAVRAFQRYVRGTGTTVAVLLVTLLAANAALRQASSGDSSLAWVDLWFLVIVGLGLVSLGFTHEPTYLVLAVIVAAVAAALVRAPDLTIPYTPWSLDPVTVLIGLVFTVMLVAETRATNRLVDQAMRNTVEARAARLLTHGAGMTAGEVGQHSAHLDAARAVLDMRSGVGASAAWVPLAAGVVVPAALDALLATLV